MLVRLLYASRATGGIDNESIEAILGQSRASNPAHGITGILCADVRSGVFMQTLEGGRTAINRLYANIVGDPRHTDVTLLDYAVIDERAFGAWHMGSIAIDRLNAGNILRYSETTTLDPYSMSAAAAQAFLLELARGAAVASRD